MIATQVFVAATRSVRSFSVILRQAVEKMASDEQLNETKNQSDQDRRLHL
jgi:hypothetical protein